MRTTTLDGPLGPVTLLGDDDGLHAVLFDAPAPPEAVRDDAALREARRQLEEWFAGSRTAFDLPERFVPYTVTAVGTVAHPSQLDEKAAEREVAPSSRIALDEVVLVKE